MIKVGIVGQAGVATATLVSLLLQHPDVRLCWVSDAAGGSNGLELAGRLPGLEGMTELRFEPEPDMAAIDVLFLDLPASQVRQWLGARELPAALRLIDMSGEFCTTADDEQGWVMALSELNRRRMVHDCLKVSVPSALTMGIALAMLPAAKNLLLANDLQITAVHGSGTAMGVEPVPGNVLQQVRMAVQTLQMSHTGQLQLLPIAAPVGRALLTVLRFKCNVALDVLQDLYDAYYDDHNFVHITPAAVNAANVVGTNRCLLHLEREGDMLQVATATDNLLKGHVGTAVHAMNLLFGLHERAGLHLQPALPV